MPKQTAQEYKQTQREYLVREQKQHEGGIKYAEGQAQEIRELIEQLDNSCDYCGNVVRTYNDGDQMDLHIQSRHEEDWVLLKEERLELARKLLVGQPESI